jgi:hypothetical protein
MKLADNIIIQVKTTGQRWLAHRDDAHESLTMAGLTFDAVKLLPIEAANAEEVASFIGDEMENQNHHSLTSVAEDLLKELQGKGFDEAHQLQVMLALDTTLSRL